MPSGLVTVLCCTVVSTVAGGTPFELDSLYSVMQALHALAHDVVRPYGGRLSPTMGDRLLILFGAPATHEDDARRAVHGAFELHRRLQVHQERLERVCRAPWRSAWACIPAWWWWAMDGTIRSCPPW